MSSCLPMVEGGAERQAASRYITGLLLVAELTKAPVPERLNDAFQMVLTGGAGEKDRTGISHESFLLMANSQSEMEEWVRAIRRVIWAPLGGGEIFMTF